MYNRIITTIVTIATITVSFPMSSLAGAKVLLTRNCMSYNHRGQPFSTLKIGAYYPLVNYVRWRNENFAQILIKTPNGSLQKVYVANRCLRGSQGRVIEY